MGKNSLPGVEIRRRKAQSLKDRENYRRQQQSARDRECNRRHQARIGHQSLTRPDQILTKPTEPSASAHRAASPPSMAPRTLPWVDSKSSITFASLFNNTQYSDVTIYLGESKVPFAAHLVVLGSRCPYFDDMFRNGFKESIAKEVSFEKDSPHAVWRALRYIYTGDYSDEPSNALTSESDDLELFKHLRVFALADMLRIDELKLIACKKFERQLEQHWISDTLPDCVREVYSTTNSVDSNSIRIAVVNTVASHKEDLVQKGPFQDLIREVGDFAVDLVLKISGNGWG
ncbi:BTB/POZ protein [Rhexocercosporidium sp. MPI-PUGE-AT-0058]|nr:BTB/POZ protein [Rhexocercosporidium sp. MPI-PUGE-AT-0058]